VADKPSEQAERGGGGRKEERKKNKEKIRGKNKKKNIVKGTLGILQHLYNR
jgi:hypothetical protein